MARLAWQNVDAPNLAPAMQGFANVTTLLDNAIKAASTNPFIDNQLKQEKLNAEIRKAKNDANTVAADRAINARVAMSPNAQALQQSLQSGQLLGQDYLDATPAVISGARTAVGDMLTNSLNQDKVSALEPNRQLAWLQQQYAGDPIGYKKALQSGQFLSPDTVNASPEAINGLSTGLTTARTNYDNTYQQNQLETTDSLNNFASTMIGDVAASGGNPQQKYNALASKLSASGATPRQIATTMEVAKNKFGIESQDPNAVIGQGKTPAASILGATATGTIPVDNTGSFGTNFSLSSRLPFLENQNYAPKVLSQIGSDISNLSIEDKVKALVPAITFTESSGRSGIVSKAGAVGLMGIMPSTAKEIASELGVKNYDLKDPATNTKFGTYYITKLLKKYDGNVEQAVAAYNAGPGTVDKAIQEQKDNPVYSKQEVSAVSNQVDRTLSKFTNDPLVVKYDQLKKSTLSTDQVISGLTKDPQYDPKVVPPSQVKGLIQRVMDMAGGNVINPETAMEIIRKRRVPANSLRRGWENTTDIFNSGDLTFEDGTRLDLSGVKEDITNLNKKGGIPDQATEYGKISKVQATLNTALQNYNAAETERINFANVNGNNSYAAPTLAALQAKSNRANELLSKAAQAVQKDKRFQDKQDTTVPVSLNPSSVNVDTTPKATYEQRQQKANAEFGSTQSTKEANLKRLNLLDLSTKTNTDFSAPGETKLNERAKYYADQGLNPEDANKAALNEYERWYNKNVLKVKDKELAKQRAAQAKLFNDSVSR